MQLITKIRDRIVRHTKSSLIYASALILVLDCVFVAINYFSSKQTLNASVLKNSQEQEREFGLTLQMTYRNMMQMALYISLDGELNKLFLEGKKAVIEEGGGKGGEKANIARQQLLKKLQPSWGKLTKVFDIRQLHYHIGPGSLSFLRVHKPQKYGDRMDDLRFIIVDTNDQKTPHYGFETGRIYSGLRGVYPVWAIDPSTGKQVHVGALETGTSFSQILPEFARYFDTNVAVLLTRKHIETKMWPEFIKEYFSKNPKINYYIESTTSANVKNTLKRIRVNNDFISHKALIILQDNHYWSVYYFPLRDYRSNINKNLEPSGFVLVWSNITSLMHTFYRGVWINVIYAFIAFLLVEAVLIWLFTREKTLALAKKEAIIDVLTNLNNRRFFDEMFAHEFMNSKRTGNEFSIIFCDIDHFKQFNDQYGHQAGDNCLKLVASTLLNNIKRGSDLVARYGGEEFVIIMPNTRLRAAMDVAESIRLEVSELKIPHVASSAGQYVTISMGVSCSANFENAMSMLKKADINLYKAKSQGRNCVVGE